jgi:hypothetical protein
MRGHGNLRSWEDLFYVFAAVLVAHLIAAL